MEFPEKFAIPFTILLIGLLFFSLVLLITDKVSLLILILTNGFSLAMVWWDNHDRKTRLVVRRVGMTFFLLALFQLLFPSGEILWVWGPIWIGKQQFHDAIHFFLRYFLLFQLLFYFLHHVFVNLLFLLRYLEKQQFHLPVPLIGWLEEIILAIVLLPEVFEFSLKGKSGWRPQSTGRWKGFHYFILHFPSFLAALTNQLSDLLEEQMPEREKKEIRFYAGDIYLLIPGIIIISGIW